MLYDPTDATFEALDYYEEKIHQLYGYSFHVLDSLGAGLNGAVFEMPNGNQALKVTTDPSELATIEELVESDLYREPGIVAIDPRTVHYLGPHPIIKNRIVGAYIMEKIQPLTEQEIFYMEEAIDNVHECLQFTKNADTFIGCTEDVLKEWPELESIVFFIYQCLSTGLWLFDVHEYNVGWRLDDNGKPITAEKGGDLVLFDVESY